MNKDELIIKIKHKEAFKLGATLRLYYDVKAGDEINCEYNNGHVIVTAPSAPVLEFIISKKETNKNE